MTKQTIAELKAEIFNTKVRVWELHNAMQTEKVIENYTDAQQKNLYNEYTSTVLKWGGVEFESWLRAIAKICKQHDHQLPNVDVFPLPKLTEGDDKKIMHLRVIAKQLNLDVTITNNRKPRPPRKTKQK